MKGNTNPNFLIEYLHEFMWRRWYGDTHPNGYFQRLLQDILLSRIRFEISVVCNAVQDIPRSTENKMFRNLKGEGRKILKLQIDLSC